VNYLLPAVIAPSRRGEVSARMSGMDDCRSSTDARLSDRNVDILMAYFEAIYWKKFGEMKFVQPACKPKAVFRQRGYWASKNPKGNTSRDQFGQSNLQPQVNALERELNEMGYGFTYLQAIQNKIQPFSLAKYLGALNRTVKAKRAKLNQPF
jgi:hypothetical protein